MHDQVAHVEVLAQIVELAVSVTVQLQILPLKITTSGSTMKGPNDNGDTTNPVLSNGRITRSPRMELAGHGRGL